MFDDRFETVKNEPNDTSLWQNKAHSNKHASDKTNDLLISTPTKAQAPTPRLPQYASDIPAALLQLPEPSVRQANNEPDQVMIPEAPEAPQAVTDFPQAVPVDPSVPRLLHQHTQSTFLQPPLDLVMRLSSQKQHLLVLQTSIPWPVSKWSVLISNNPKATPTQ